MYCFYINGVGITASFRVPETHTFHQTLPLPPRTTLIGLMGAALGLSLEKAHEFAKKSNILVSVSGSHKGMMKDLWNYRKVTNKEITPEKMKKREHYSVLTREYLVYPEFTFVYASENKAELEKVWKSFHSPVYALTAGNSDDLLKIRDISEIEEVEQKEVNFFSNTVLPGNLSDKCKYDVKSLLKDKPITYSLKMPEVFTLPTDFAFNGEIRSGIKKEAFTFVSSQVNLEEPLQGYLIGDQNYILY